MTIIIFGILLLFAILWFKNNDKYINSDDKYNNMSNNADNINENSAYFIFTKVLKIAQHISSTFTSRGGKAVFIDVIEGKNKTFIENKNRIVIVLCKPNGEVYDMDSIILSIVHELAHAFSNSYDIDHTSFEFINTEKSLRHIAIELGYIKSTSKISVDYMMHAGEF